MKTTQTMRIGFVVLTTALIPALAQAAAVTPVYTTLATVSAAFQAVVGETPTGVTTLFKAMLFVAGVLWIAWQMFTSVGLFTRSNIGLLDLSVINIRSIVLVVALFAALSIS